MQRVLPSAAIIGRVYSAHFLKGRAIRAAGGRSHPLNNETRRAKNSRRHVRRRSCASRDRNILSDRFDLMGGVQAVVTAVKTPTRYTYDRTCRRALPFHSTTEIIKAASRAVARRRADADPSAVPTKYFAGIPRRGRMELHVRCLPLARPARTAQHKHNCTSRQGRGAESRRAPGVGTRTHGRVNCGGLDPPRPWKRATPPRATARPPRRLVSAFEERAGERRSVRGQNELGPWAARDGKTLWLARRSRRGRSPKPEPTGAREFTRPSIGSLRHRRWTD